MKRIYLTEFIQQWNIQYDDWYGKFSAKNIDEHAYFGTSQNEDWFFIWNGQHVIFGNDELIPGETLVYGVRNEPKFISMRNFVKTFVFTNHNPITSTPCKGMPIEKGSPAEKRLNEIKNRIAA